MHNTVTREIDTQKLNGTRRAIVNFSYAGQDVIANKLVENTTIEFQMLAAFKVN
jgi:hypothetical protein